jgi:hypothetical protein
MVSAAMSAAANLSVGIRNSFRTSGSDGIGSEMPLGTLPEANTRLVRDGMQGPNVIVLQNWADWPENAVAMMAPMTNCLFLRAAGL